MAESRRQAPVVVGVDGSAGSLAAIALGAWEAKRRRAPLHLVHGLADQSAYAAYGWAPPAALSGSLRDEATSMLTDVETRTRADHPGLAVAATLVAGGGAGALVDQSQGAALVIVGSRGQSDFGCVALGSVAAQVTMHAHAPVIVVRPAAVGLGGAAVASRVAPAVGPVVVGVDGSPGSVDALAFAFDEASARGVNVLAIYVWLALSPQDLARDDGSPGQCRLAAEQMLADAVTGWAKEYPDVPVSQRAIHHVNTPWALAEASRMASLLVVGTRGRGGFANLPLGSVSHSLVAQAACPIAVVRRTE